MADTIVVVESITPNVSITLSNDQGPQGTPGNTGATGATGATGNFNNRYLGAWSSVTTYAIGDIVTYSGSSYIATLANTNEIPSGSAKWSVVAAKGDTGATGATGPTGATGATGATGSAATISVGTTNTLIAGNNATVTNSGTSSAAVFNFGIPQGPTGATGATGAQGPSGVIGVTAPITNSGTTTSANIGITDASTTVKGAVQLTDSTASTSIITAATPNSVKTAYDLANGKPSLSANTPSALGTAAAGAGTAASKDDHVHPTTGLAVLANANTFGSTQTQTMGKVLANGSTTGSANQGAIAYGTLGYSDQNNLATFQSGVNTYNQIVVQNTSAAAAASADFTISNDLGTNSTYYGNLGMNSSGFSGTGSLNAPNNVYLTATSSDLVLGTTTANQLRVVTNNSTTDAFQVNSSGVITNATISMPAIDNPKYGTTFTTTAAGTTTLTVSSNNQQVFTGTTTQTVVLPVVSTLTLGMRYKIMNQSTGAITVNSSGGNLVVTVAAGTNSTITCVSLTGTTAASWYVDSSGASSVPVGNITGLGTGVATFLATPTSANLASAVTNETGSGALVFGTGPTISKPIIDNPLQGYTTTASSGTAIVLTTSSNYQQFITGSTAQTFTLPDVTTLTLGQAFKIVNNSTATATVNSSGGNLVISVPTGFNAEVVCILTSGTTAASWSASFCDFDTVTGTGSVVLSASPTFTGTVTTPISSITSYQKFGTPNVITSANYTVLDTDTFLSFNRNAGVTVTLPTASSYTGRMLYLKLINTGGATSATANVVPLAGTAAATTLFSASTVGKFTIIVSNGTNWEIYAQN